MRISLITPCFNAARFVRETLASVLDQNYGDLEYIVVDGGSSDGTADIIREQRDRLAWWVSEPDKGQTSALNKGLARTTGEVLGFLNADDVLTPGSLQAVSEAFEKNPEIDMVYGGVEWIDADGTLLGTHTGKISTLEEILDIYCVWWVKRQWVQPEVFFRRRLWERVGEFDPQYHLAFDFDYWVRCFLAGARVLQIPHRLVRFRLHENQKSTASRRAAGEIRHIVQRTLAANPPIPGGLRRRLKAQLSYDRYQAGEDCASTAPARVPFAQALLGHPEWLLYAPEVRERIRTACVRHWLRASKSNTRDR